MPPRCVRTKGYFQELAYYMDYSAGIFEEGTEKNNDGERFNIDNDDSSWFPPVPPLTAAVAPPALQRACAESPTPSPHPAAVLKDLHTGTTGMAPVILHVRRCGQSHGSKTKHRNTAKSSAKTSERALLSGFYPALPLEYYLKAIREADVIAGAEEGSSESTTSILIITPENCRRSPVVSALFAAYPKRAQLASSVSTLAAVAPESLMSSRASRSRTTSRTFEQDSRSASKQKVAPSSATDFGLLRGGAANGGSLILSVGTFSFVAAWLALDDNNRTLKQNHKYLELSTKEMASDSRRRHKANIGPSSVHMPLAGCQRRFVPLQVPQNWLLRESYHSSSSSSGTSSVNGTTSTRSIDNRNSSSVFGTVCRVVALKGSTSKDIRQSMIQKGVLSSANAAAESGMESLRRRESGVVLHRPRPCYHAGVLPVSVMEAGFNEPESKWNWVCEDGSPLP